MLAPCTQMRTVALLYACKPQVNIKSVSLPRLLQLSGSTLHKQLQLACACWVILRSSSTYVLIRVWK